MQEEKATPYVIKRGFDVLFHGEIAPELVKMLIFAVI